MKILNIGLLVICLFFAALAFEKSYYLDKATTRMERCFKLIDQQAAVIKVAEDNTEKYEKLAHDWEATARTLTFKMDSIKRCKNGNTRINYADEVIIGK